MAQSVPTASWLPCVRALPVGFSFKQLQATDRGSHFSLNSGGEGTRALRVELASTCDLRDANETPSAQDGVRRYERIDDASFDYRGEWHFIFTGGCITYVFTLHGTTGAASADALSSSLGFVSRGTIARLLHDYSGGRLELDPTSGGGTR
jgi:hypothetical protein